MPPTSTLDRSRWAAALLAAGALVAACGSSGGPVTIGLDQRGQTVTVTRGQRVDVTLTGADWDFGLSPAFGPLTETATHFSASRKSSSSTADFVAGETGTATVHATWAGCRQQRCAPGQGTFSVRVVVGS